MSEKATVQGVGYVGDTATRSNGKLKTSYRCWYDMLRRVYTDKSSRSHRYLNVEVCDEWKCFANFEKWYDKNYVEGFLCDKDLRVPGSNTYSPESCEFVPLEVNSLLGSCNKRRGEYPVGVSCSKNGRIFRSGASVNGSFKSLGCYKTPEEAFQAYKEAKEEYVKDVAHKYFMQGAISYQIYTNLLNWEAVPFPD